LIDADDEELHRQQIFIAPSWCSPKSRLGRWRKVEFMERECVAKRL